MIKMNVNSNKPIAIVLGGTNPHIELIKRLKKRDYLIYLIDYLENPPAKSYADFHIKENALDKHVVLSIAKELNPKMVISTNLDRTIPVATYVSEKMNIYHPLSYDTSLKVTDKAKMKHMMIANNIPTGKFVTVRENDDVKSVDFNFNYPVIVKPVDGTGSLGVRKVFKEKDLKTALDDSFKISKLGEVLIEELYKGVEVSVDCFVSGGKAHVLMTRQKHTIVYDEFNTILTPGSVSPANISIKACEKINEIAQNIAVVFGLNNIPLLIQAFIDNEEVKIIEIAARIGGGTHVSNIQCNTGFDILKASIDSFEAKSNSEIYVSDKFFSSSNMVYASSGIIESVIGFDKLKEDGIVEEFFIWKTRGSEVAEEVTNRNRVAGFIVKGLSENEVLDKIKYTMNNIDVLDANHKSMIIRDIYIKKFN